jgi:hypothetical protein
MYFNVSRENILRMFRNEHRERLNAAGKGQLDSLADMLDIADAALNAVLDIINEETQVALDSFQQGALDSRRESRGMTGPGVVSSQEVKRSPIDDLAEKVGKSHDGAIHRELKQDLATD